MLATSEVEEEVIEAPIWHRRWQGRDLESGPTAGQLGPRNGRPLPSACKHAHGAESDEDAAHIAITDGETVWDYEPRFKEYPSRPGFDDPGDADRKPSG